MYVEPLSDEAQTNLQLLYVSWIADPNVCDLLAFDLQLRFDIQSNKILVCKQAETIPDLVGTIGAAFLAAWDFKKFTDSRWATLGYSARSISTGALLGLRSLVSLITADTSNSTFHLNGFSKLDDAMMTFFLVMGNSSRSMDNIIVLLMADNRAAKQVDDMEFTIKEEMDWLTSLPASYWSSLAALVPTSTPIALQSQTLRSARKSVSFFEARVLKELKGRPWCLGRGDILQNLSVLASEPDAPSCKITLQLKTLTKKGFPEQKLVGIVKLLQELPVTSMTAEQQHASAAVLMRYHPDYSRQTAISRALILQVNRQLPHPSREEKAVAKLEAQLKKLEKRAPDKACARQLYFRDLMQELQKQRSRGKQFPAGIRLKLMTKHATYFREHTAAFQRQYENLAIATQQEKHEQLAESVEEVRAELAVARERLTASRKADKHMAPDSCRWGNAELTHFADLLQSPHFTDSVIQQRVADALTSPRPPRGDRLKELFGVALWPKPARKRPSWLAAMAGLRDHFESTVLQVQPGGDKPDEWYEFMFARQSPQLVSLCPLQLVDESCKVAADVVHMTIDEIATSHRFCWTYEHLGSLDADDLCDVPMESISVVRHCWLSGNQVRSVSRPVPLPVFVESFPAVKAGIELRQ